MYITQEKGSNYYSESVNFCCTKPDIPPGTSMAEGFRDKFGIFIPTANTARSCCIKNVFKKWL